MASQLVVGPLADCKRVPAEGQDRVMRRGILAVLAYLVPTFLTGFVWHLVLFHALYQRLEIYRPDPLIPLGVASMMASSSGTLKIGSDNSVPVFCCFTSSQPLWMCCRPIRITSPSRCTV